MLNKETGWLLGRKTLYVTTHNNKVSVFSPKRCRYWLLWCKSNLGISTVHSRRVAVVPLRWTATFPHHTFLTLLKAAGPANELPVIPLCIAHVGRCFVLSHSFPYSTSKLGSLRGTVILKAFINFDLDVGGYCVSKRRSKESSVATAESVHQSRRKLLNSTNSESISCQKESQWATLEDKGSPISQ